jgi:hypothetical protein
MTRGWTKSLLFNIAIVATVLLALLCSVASVSAYEVSPSHRDVSLSFGQTEDNTKKVFFTITNNGNISVSDDIKILDLPVLLLLPAALSRPPA